MRKLVLLVTVISLISGCTSNPQQSDSNQETFDGLVQVKNTKMDRVWVKPGFDPSAYTKIMITGAGIEYRPVKETMRTRTGSASQFPISNENKSRLEDIVLEEFQKALSGIKGYEIVDTADAETLLIEIGLSDVVSEVPPNQFGRTEVYLSQVGEATLILEFRDAQSGAVLVRGTDRRAAKNYGQFVASSPITTWPVVRRLAKSWATGLQRGIDDMSGVGR